MRFNLGLNDNLIEHVSEPRVKTVHYRFIDDPKPQGTGWFHYDNIVFGLDGVRIFLDDVRHDAIYEIGRDHNDVLRIAYCLNGDSIAGQMIPAKIIRGGGIAVSRVRVPNAATVSGYDEIRIVPERGDGWYSVSHIRFIPEDLPP
jgi:hypothetical protein